MEFYILNTNFTKLAIVDTFKSVIWTRRYYESGDFELCVPATQEMLEVLRKDYYIVRADDTTQCMIIENIELKTDVENGNELIVSGRSLSSILNRRVIYANEENATMTVSGTVEECIRKLIDSNAIISDWQYPEYLNARKLGPLELGDEIGITTAFKAQFTGDNLETAIQNICKNNGIGCDITFDLANNKFIFILTQGKDRTYSQSENPRVIFSNDFDNLLTSNYTTSNKNYKNFALVGGQGEGKNRIWAAAWTVNGVSGGPDKLDRYEMYVDAKDINDNDGEISASDYLGLLTERGLEKLSEHQITEAIEGEVTPDGNFKFGIDYFLGDIVEVVNEYGITFKSRIIEVIESEDDTGHYLIPTFGDI